MWKRRSDWTRRVEEGSGLRFLIFMQLMLGQSHKRPGQERGYVKKGGKGKATNTPV